MAAMTHVSADRKPRADRLRELMQRRGVGAILLRRPQNFAWYTNGADSRVDHASPLGVADIVVTPEAEYVLTSNIEAQRMREEQTPDFEVIEYPWHEDGANAIRETTGGAALGADLPPQAALDVTDEVASLRRVLDPDATERYLQVGADATAAIEEVAGLLEPAMDEREAAARLAAACRRRGLSSPVLLAASGERIGRYRHPIPHGETLGRRAMLVASAERGGLYANITRIVHFEEPDAELKRRLAACEEILRRLREEATQPGRTLSEAFADCQRFYAEAGFSAEWRLHHQGGITGYASREIIATPQTHEEIRPGHAFAWNPSITGAKSEETFILTESGPCRIT